LVLAVRNVHMEVLLGVLEDVLREVDEHDVVLPRALEVAEQPVGALQHWNDVREQSLAVSWVERLGVTECWMVHEVAAQKVERFQVRRLRRQDLEFGFLQSLLVLTKFS
jgi:hypothetical protein